MFTTSATVAKKTPADPPADKGPANVKIERDLHRIARSLAGYHDKELGKLIDEALRPVLMRMHAEMIEEVQGRKK